MGNRTVKVILDASVTGLTAGLATARKSVADFGGELDTMSKKHHDNFNKLTTAGGALGLGLTAAFGLAAKASMDFDRQMSAVASVSDASGKALGDLRAAALQAGKDTIYSASEAAKAEEELAKAGISTSNILGGALTGTLSLASAGTIDLADAATIAAQAMNVFKLKGSDVGHIADVLASGANKSAADVGQLGDGLKQGGLVAAQYGLSLEDTVGVLSAFADRALVGSDAGTSLKTMLQSLSSTAPKTVALMKELGINAYDAGGKFIGITALAGQLRDKLGGLTQAQRDAAMAQIFGSDATRAASVLYDQGAQGIQGYINAVNDQGAAQRTAAEKTNNLAGDLERLKGSFETLAIQAGSGANGGLRTLVKTADSAVSAFAGLPGPVQSTVTVIAGVGGVSLLAVTGLLKLRSTAGDAMTALRDMGPMGERAATGLGKIGTIAGRATAVGVALLLAYEGGKAFADWASRNSKPVQVDVDGMAKSLNEFARSGKATGEMAKTFGTDLGGIAKAMHTLSTAQTDLKQATENYVPVAGRGMTQVNRHAEELIHQSEQAKAALAGLDDGLAKLASDGGATQAKLAFEQLAAQTGINLDQLPKYKEAAAQAAAANGGLAKGFGDASQNARTMAGSLQEAITKGQTLIDVWKQLNGATLSFDQSQLNAQTALDAVAKSFHDNGKAIEGNSRAAIENRVKVGEMAQAAADAAQKKYEETGSVTDATAVYDGYMAALRKVLHDAHLTDAQIAALIATYGQMPAAATTNVSAPGARTAKQQADDLNTAIANIPKSKQTSFWANTSSATAAVNALKLKIAELQNKNIYVHGTVYWTSSGDLKLPGGTSLKGAASGGPVEGPGPKGVDSKLMMLAPGEHVLTAREVDAMGGQQAVSAWRASLMSGAPLTDYGAAAQQPQYVTMGGGGGGSSTHRIILQWPDGRVAGEIVAAGLVDGRGMTGFKTAVVNRGGSVKALNL